MTVRGVCCWSRDVMSRFANLRLRRAAARRSPPYVSPPYVMTPAISRNYDNELRQVALMLIVAGALSACGDVVVGPVDHSCHSNPSLGQGSGCSEHGHGSG